MLVCASAAKLPTASEAQTSTATVTVQRCSSAGNAVISTRSITASAAVFVAADMNPVTGVGAPSYTSGVHMWNGAAEVLKPKPTSSIASPPTSSASPLRCCVAVAAAICSKPIVPVAP